MRLLVAATHSDTGPTFTTAMEHVAQAFEGLGAAVLVVGVLWACVLAVIVWRRTGRAGRSYTALRQVFGGALLLSLEVLVAADLIRTVAVSPTLTNVLVLGLIVLIRTFLAFSLETEIDGVPPWRRALATGAGTVRRASDTALGPGPPLSQAGEQVRLGHARSGPIGNPDKTLLAERGFGDVGRQLAEPGILNLAGVRHECIALAVEDRKDVDGGRDARLGFGCLPQLLGRELTRVRDVRALVTKRLPDLAP